MSYYEITGRKYTELLVKRLKGEVPELTWLKQCRKILQPNLHQGTTLLDIGCATGYAYNTFKDLDIAYTGLDIEQKYLDIASQYFGSTEANVKFIRHDIANSPSPVMADVVICSAILEHCPSLLPALDNLINATKQILILRTFLGETEHIHCIPSPVAKYRKTHRKYTNQYSLKEVLTHIEASKFQTRVYRDEYTDSMPQLVDGAIRTFYIIYADIKQPQN